MSQETNPSLPQQASEQPLEALKARAAERGITVPAFIENQELLARFLREQLGEGIAKDASDKAEEVKAEIVARNEGQQEYFPFAPVPTDLCRTSPFFPLAKKDLANRENIDNYVVTEGSWGRIRYTGKKLSTYEEDVLMAVLAVIDKGKNVETTEVENRLTYRYKGPMLPIIKLTGLTDAASSYEFVLRALEMLSAGSVVMEIYRRDAKGKRKVVKTAITNMVTFAQYDRDSRELSVTINPYFYEIYVKENYSLIDVMRRAQIKSPVAKAVYRFISSHAADRWPGWNHAHYSTLAKSINLNPQLGERSQKDQIRKAIKALTSEGILLKGSYLKGDKVVLERNPNLNRRERKSLK